MGKIRGRKRLMQWIDRRETVIRAALTHDTYSAERAAKSNNVQIITMGAWVIGPEVAKSIVDTWLASKFDPAGPSAGNVMAIDKLDSGKLVTL